jgi:hypothetical protein
MLRDVLEQLIGEKEGIQTQIALRVRLIQAAIFGLGTPEPQYNLPRHTTATRGFQINLRLLPSFGPNEDLLEGFWPISQHGYSAFSTISAMLGLLGATSSIADRHPQLRKD